MVHLTQAKNGLDCRRPGELHGYESDKRQGRRGREIQLSIYAQVIDREELNAQQNECWDSKQSNTHGGEHTEKVEKGGEKGTGQGRRGTSTRVEPRATYEGLVTQQGVNDNHVIWT